MYKNYDRSDVYERYVYNKRGELNETTSYTVSGDNSKITTRIYREKWRQSKQRDDITRAIKASKLLRNKRTIYKKRKISLWHLF